MEKQLLMFLLSTLLMTAAQAQVTPSADSNLLSRVQHGDRSAILEAGKTGDKSFVPVLEAMARPQFVGGVDPESVKGLDPQRVKQLNNAVWHPVYDDPSAVNARMALAKLGVKEYLDEILLELTNPTSSPTYREYEGHPAFPPSHDEPIHIRVRAFDKLVYIRDRSTVRPIASFLSVASEPISADSDVKYDTYADMAMRALAELVDNPPQVNLPAVYETLDARSKIWQQWWEQNKDKYP